MSANITDIAALDEFRRALIKFREELGIAVSSPHSSGLSGTACCTGNVRSRGLMKN